MKNINTRHTNQPETTKKPFYQDDVLMPICVERGGNLEGKIYAFECILESLGTFPHMLEFMTNGYLPVAEEKEGKVILSGLQQMSKIYHLFAVEQYQLLKDKIRAETNEKASI